jgi:divalent metal cation (Fe/Co/Zn/Cd) transporter
MARVQARPGSAWINANAVLDADVADASTAGLVLAAMSLAVMLTLSWAQRRASRQLGSASAVADSKQTPLCTYLSAVLLVGLGLNAWSGRRGGRPGHRRDRRPRGRAGLARRHVLPTDAD